MGHDVELISPKQASQMSLPPWRHWDQPRTSSRVGRQCPKALVLALRPAGFDRDDAAHHEAVFRQVLMERRPQRLSTILRPDRTIYRALLAAGRAARDFRRSRATLITITGSEISDDLAHSAQALVASR